MIIDVMCTSVFAMQCIYHAVINKHPIVFQNFYIRKRLVNTKLHCFTKITHFKYTHHIVILLQKCLMS